MNEAEPRKIEMSRRPVTPTNAVGEVVGSIGRTGRLAEVAETREAISRELADTVGSAVVEALSERRETLSGIELELGEESQDVTFWGGTVRVVSHANLSGLWHYSGSSLDRFDPAKVPDQSIGKFGRGTYLGAGKLTGETVDLLIKHGATKHDVTLEDATLLVINRKDIKDIMAKSREAAGEPPSVISGNSLRTDGNLANRLASLDFGVGPIDGLVIRMNDDSSELCLLSEAFEKATVSPVAT